METNAARAIWAADSKPAYDANMKKLLSDKQFLSRIMKATVSEFADCTLDEIEASIEGTPDVDVRTLFTKDNAAPPKEKHDAIIGMRNESKIPGEGTTTFDIVFYAITPGDEHIKLIINLEAQKDYHPGYDLVTRAVFYCSRLLSAQMDTEFTAEHYDDLKKVYSIFICIQAPKFARNTITEYKMMPKDILGTYTGNARYDLLSVIMVRMGNPWDSESGSEMINMLSLLLTTELSELQKKSILQNKFGIRITNPIEKGVEKMCNWSDYIEEQAMEKGMQKGMEKGMEKGLEQGKALVAKIFKAVQANPDNADNKEIATLCECSEDEVESIRQALGI